MSGLMRVGTAEATVSRDQILRRERGDNRENTFFLFS